mmetsp:Transcript_746/g.2270  ORF Transcript_746/g.2270 Transcript_746/m.2270 type:complete len:120 (-) Transcript_746:23-382(-)
MGKPSFTHQWWGLLRKNGLLTWRSKVSSALQLGAPLLCLGLVTLVAWAVQNNEFMESTSPAGSGGPHQAGSTSWSSASGKLTERKVTHIPDCKEDVFLKDDCKAFVYAPNDVPMVQVRL